VEKGGGGEGQGLGDGGKKDEVSGGDGGLYLTKTRAEWLKPNNNRFLGKKKGLEKKQKKKGGGT